MSRACETGEAKPGTWNLDGLGGFNLGAWRGTKGFSNLYRVFGPGPDLVGKSGSLVRHGGNEIPPSKRTGISAHPFSDRLKAELRTKNPEPEPELQASVRLLGETRRE